MKHNFKNMILFISKLIKTFNHNIQIADLFKIGNYIFNLYAIIHINKSKYFYKQRTFIIYPFD